MDSCRGRERHGDRRRDEREGDDNTSGALQGQGAGTDVGAAVTAVLAAEIVYTPTASSATSVLLDESSLVHSDTVTETISGFSSIKYPHNPAGTDGISRLDAGKTVIEHSHSLWFHHPGTRSASGNFPTLVATSQHGDTTEPYESDGVAGDNYSVYLPNNGVEGDDSNNKLNTYTTGGIKNDSDVTYNEWNHLVITVSKTKLEVYYNGVHQPTLTHTFSSDYGGKRYFKIGNAWGGGFPFEGHIRDYEFYEDTLTADEITNLYNNGSTAPPKSTVTGANLTFDGFDQLTLTATGTNIDSGFGYLVERSADNSTWTPVAGGSGMVTDGGTSAKVTITQAGHYRAKAQGTDGGAAVTAVLAAEIVYTPTAGSGGQTVPRAEVYLRQR